MLPGSFLLLMRRHVGQLSHKLSCGLPAQRAAWNAARADGSCSTPQPTSIM